MNRELLAIYLNDHLAGSVAGLELAKRTRNSNEGNEYGPFLDRLATEIEEDRRALEELMQRLDVGRDRVKCLGAWAGEKAGRLKLNGQITGYSPLSRLIELEGLTLGVRGKLALWRSLARLEDPALDPEAIQKLIGRAESQLDELEEHRQLAAGEAFAEGP